MADRILEQPDPEPEPMLGCTASILDRRFHTKLSPASATQPLLLTMVDAEEAFDWGAPFSRAAIDVSSMASQHLAHRIFERHGVVPIYLADYPVVSQAAGYGPLLELLQGGHCEIGTQMHPWVTPPFVEAVNEHNSYPGNLPTLLEYEKARVLTDAIAERFGQAPLIYRSGRFGAGPRTADILKRLGYQADSSLSPYWPPEDLAQSANIWALSSAPYWVDREKTLLEVPTSAALVGQLPPDLATHLAPIIYRRGATWLSGAMANLGLLERIRLTPEGISIVEAKRLTRAMLAQGHRVFVLTYHSPSLAPGNTPYVRNQNDLVRFLSWLEEYYCFFREEMGGHCGGWQDIVATRTATPLREAAIA
jgi:hypothetical protein